MAKKKNCKLQKYRAAVGEAVVHAVYVFSLMFYTILTKISQYFCVFNTEFMMQINHFNFITFTGYNKFQSCFLFIKQKL